MNNYSFYKTEDNSTGLYSLTTKDIFHSKTGALKEAYDKFILPSLLCEKLQQKSEIKILDICSGVGYNLKAALNEVNKQRVIIDSIEICKKFLFLTPFLEDSINNDELKFFILSELIRNDFSLEEILDYNFEASKNENKQFFSPSMLNLVEFNQNYPYKTLEQPQNNLFLHNIYYNYISTHNIECKNNNKYNNCSINYHIGDARKTIKELNTIYDIVFFDAFSSQKDPTLWTINLLSIIKDKMNEDSVFVSYSKATPFRSALLELGFNVGKTYIDGIDMGTAASKNLKYISNPLSDYDFKLIQTRSGITYKDNQDFSLTPDEILKNRELEQKSSNRLSHTQFLKHYSS